MRRPGLSLVYSHWSGIAGGLGMLAATIATQVIISSTGTGDPVVIDGAMQATESFAPMGAIAAASLLGFGLFTHYLATLELARFKTLLAGFGVAVVVCYVGALLAPRPPAGLSLSGVLVATLTTIALLAPLALLVGSTRYCWRLVAT